MTVKILDLAEHWAGCNCLLNGEKAKIIGRLDDFATIMSMESYQKASYSWMSVDKIMQTGGRFLI